jgi:outer membrane protein TolC
MKRRESSFRFPADLSVRTPTTSPERCRASELGQRLALRRAVSMHLHMSATTVILIAALGVTTCSKAQTSDGEVLTLDEAIALARSNNRDLKQSGLEIGKQRQALGEAKTQFYPRLDTSLLAAQLLTPLDFTINASQFGTFPGTGPIPGSNVDLHTPARPVALAAMTLTQPLTQLLRIHLFVAEQRLRVDSTKLSFDRDSQKLVDDVRQAYYVVLQTQSQLESQQSIFQPSIGA